MLRFSFLQLQLRISTSNLSSKLIFQQNVFYVLFYYKFIENILIVLINFSLAYMREIAVIVVWVNKNMYTVCSDESDDLLAFRKSLKARFHMVL